MEDYRKRARRNRRLKEKPTDCPPALSLPTIAEFIEDGQITIGTLPPAGCVAAAADEDGCYVMLIRRRDESLLHLLTRLDQALDDALTLGKFTDEVNR